MEVGLGPGHGPGHVALDGDSAPQRKGAQQPATFRPMSIVAKRLPISATAELLFMAALCSRCEHYIYGRPMK